MLTDAVCELQGFVKATAMILVSEIGDKTFFVAAVTFLPGSLSCTHFHRFATGSLRECP